MERETLITNARLRNAANRYARYIAVCLRHVRTESGTMQLRQDIRDELALREQIADGKVAQLACQVNNGFTCTNAALASLQNTINTITRTVIPKDAICPEVMPRYNNWVAPTATETAPATQPVVVQQGNNA